MGKLSITDKGRKLASIRTVRSYIPRTYSIQLYENWIEIGPTGRKGMPVKGATLNVGKASAGQTIASTAAFAPVGVLAMPAVAVVMKMRQRVTVSNNGFSFTVYCYGRDRQQLLDFIQSFQAAA
jgi:hypothetical protein